MIRDLKSELTFVKEVGYSEVHSYETIGSKIKAR